MPSIDVLTAALDDAGVSYELLEHPRTDRAADEAATLGIPPNEVGKTIVLTAGDANVRVVLPASERIDMLKLRDLLGTGKELHLLTEVDLARGYPGFELGAVPPLGGPADEVVVDARIAALEHVVFAAGQHDRSVRVPAAELVSATGVRVADVSVD